MSETTITFQHVVQNHPVIHRMQYEGATPESMIVALYREREILLGELMKLHSICPKKIEVDGTTYVWHCPDHLIPKTP